MDDGQFDEILIHLLSNDNENRKKAEEYYDHLKKESPEMVGSQLIRVLQVRSPGAEAVRSLAAVLLRLLLGVRSDFWPRLTPQVQAAVKATLLACLGTEPLRTVQRKIAHTIAQLATLTILDAEAQQQGGQAGWPEVVQITVTLCQSQDPQQTEAGLHLLGKLVEYIGDLPGMSPQMLYEMLQSGLGSTHRGVQIAALLTLCSILQDIMAPDDLKVLRPLLPSMLKILEGTLNSGDEAIAQEALTALGDIAEKQPQYLRHSLNEVGQAMLMVAGAQALEVGTRQLALEFLTSLCEHLGAVVRKSAAWVLEAMLPLTMNMLLQVEDDPGWVTRLCFDGEDEDEMDNLSEIAAMALDRMSMAIGSSIILTVLFPIAREFIADSTDWRKRRAGVMAVGLVAEGCKEEVYQQLGGSPESPGILQVLLPFARDPHPRVRDALLSTLSIFSEDFKNMGFQRTYANLVLPALSESLGGMNSTIPRLQALACNSVTSFCVPGCCDRNEMMQHAPSLLEGLFVCLSGPVLLQTDAITAVAMLASVVGNLFGHFYDRFIPLAKSLLSLQGSENEVSVLKGKAMEAISLMGAAVGKERFMVDGHELVQALLDNVLKGFFESGDPQLAYALMSCARIAGVLKEEFVTYLPNVLTTLLQILSKEIETSVVDAEQMGSVDQLFQGKDVVKVNVRGAGSHLIALNTAEVQEKEMCAQTLYQLISDMGVLMAPWVAQVTPLVIPLIKYKAQETIRIVASAAIPKLLQIGIDGAKAGSVPNTLPKQLFDAFLPALIQILKEGATTEELEPYCVSADSLAQLLKMQRDLAEAVGGGGAILTLEQAQAVLTELRDATAASLARSQQRLSSVQAEEDYDEEEYDIFEEAETWEKDLLTSVLEGAGALIKQYKSGIFQVFHSIFGGLIEKLVPEVNAPVAARSFIYCLCIDCLENCGPQAAIYFPNLIPSVLQGISDANPEIRQACAYAIGVCAIYGGAQFDPICTHSLGLLFQMMTAEGAREEDNGNATDNAASSVLKVCQHRPDLCNTSQILPSLLEYFPLRWDLVEAHDAHARLVQMIKDGDKAIVGADFSNVPALVAFFSEVMKYQEPEDEEQYSDEECLWESQLVCKETRQQIEELLQQMKASVPEEIMASAFSQLDDAQRYALQLPTSAFLIN